MKRTRKINEKKKASLGHVIRRVLIPHRHNDFRPYLIRQHGLIAVMLIALSMNAGYVYLDQGDVLGERSRISSDDLLIYTNTYRAENGLRELSMNSQLAKAATLKAQNILDEEYWAHVSPSGVTPWQLIEMTGYDYQDAGENLARGFGSAGGTVTAWMNSDEHRANVLGAMYQDVGFGIVDGISGGEKTTVVVAMYGSSRDVLAGAVNDTSTNAANGSLAPIAYVGIGLQSLSPVALATIALLLVTALVALSAHAYRDYMPEHIKTAWYRHHGLYKALSLSVITVVVIGVYGGGQI